MAMSSTRRPILSEYRIVRNGTGAKIFDGSTVKEVTATSIKDFSEKIQNSKAPVIVGFQGLSRSQVGRIIQGIRIGRGKKVTLVNSQLIPKQDQIAILIESEVSDACDSPKNGRNTRTVEMQKRRLGVK